MRHTETYIDNQTLGGAVRALEAGEPSLWSLWATQSILTATNVLISVPELRISPSARVHSGILQAYAGTSGNHGVMGVELSSAIGPYTPDAALTEAAARTVRQWALRNSGRIATALSSLSLLDEYHAWIDYETSGGWQTATVIINGIVDETFLLPISHALGIGKEHAEEILVRSRDREIVGKWVKASYNGEDKQIARVMFTAGALLRGRYHDRIAESFGTNIIHHPIRRCILKDVGTGAEQAFSSSNASEYLSKIIIAASLQERNATDRVKLWCANVKLVRQALLDAKSISLPQADLSNAAALRAALRAAQDSGIRAHSKILDGIVHHAVGLGAGAATSFVLHPWLFPVAYLGTELALTAAKGHALPSLWSRSSYRLTKLAQSVPGRLSIAG